MQIKKALITAAGPDQRNLPLQTLIDSDGNRKTVLEILIGECNRAGIEEIGVKVASRQIRKDHSVILKLPGETSKSINNEKLFLVL